MKRLITIVTVIIFTTLTISNIYGRGGDLNPYLQTQSIFSQPYRAIIESGDTVIMVSMRNIVIYPKYKAKNNKEAEAYWRTVRDVKKTLPYAKMVRAALIETYEFIETLPEDKREAHLKKMEEDIYEEYKPILKSFTYSQAHMLIKLINRECNQSSFHLIKAFLGGFRAGFWNSFGRLFGIKLKDDYNPKKNKDDKIIEQVCQQVESGML